MVLFRGHLRAINGGGILQNLTDIPAAEGINLSRSRINDNFETLKSNFSGTSFPTLNLTAGMTCFRTDEGYLGYWGLKSLNPDIWIKLNDVTKEYLDPEYVLEQLNEKADLSGAEFTGPVKGTFSGDLIGNANTATKLKKGIKITIADGVTSTPITIDGSGDIVISVTKVKDSVIEWNGSTTVKANLKGNVTGDLTGNVSGNVTGNVKGDVTGNVTGNVSGSAKKITELSSTTGTFSATPTPPIVTTIYTGRGDSARLINTSYTSVFPAGEYSLQDILQILMNRCYNTTLTYEKYSDYSGSDSGGGDGSGS